MLWSACCGVHAVSHTVQCLFPSHPTLSVEWMLCVLRASATQSASADNGSIKHQAWRQFLGDCRQDPDAHDENCSQAITK